MTHKPSRTRFWTILTIVNILAMAYPISLYFRAESNDAQFFAAVAVLGVGFLLAITDTVSALVAYMGELG